MVVGIEELVASEVLFDTSVERVFLTDVVEDMDDAPGKAFDGGTVILILIPAALIAERISLKLLEVIAKLSNLAYFEPFYHDRIFLAIA